MKKFFLKIKNNIWMYITFFIGILLRLYFGLISNYKILQHDVTHEYGHMDYAIYLYKNMSLPLTNEWEFYQPPFNAFMQSMMMRIMSIIKSTKNVARLYNYCNVLSIIYSIITLVFIYKILKRFCKNEFSKNFTFFIVSIYPGLIFQATQFNNDPPSLMFFIMSLYFIMMWCKLIHDKKSIVYIILAALTVGLGMLSKISVGIIAFIAGPMMLIMLIKHRSRKVFLQLLIFALIAFPLGLSFSIRNLILFDQPLNYVLKLDYKNIYVGDFSITERFLSFPVSQLFFGKSSIYHDFKEYNIWIDVIKTSTYDEANFFGTIYHIPCFILLILNTIFFILSVLATVYRVFTIRKSEDKDLTYLSIIVIFVSIISFIIFNADYPVSCTSSYRYIAITTPAFAYLLSTVIPVNIANNSFFVV